MWGKKDKQCSPDNPADQTQGSYWDHVFLDAPSRLIVTLVIGRRTEETLRKAFQDFYQRTDRHLPALITTDAYACYGTVIITIYGVWKTDLELTEAEKIEYGFDDWPALLFPEEIAYGTVQKERAQGRVVGVHTQVVLGTEAQVAATLAACGTGQTIHTSYVERWNGTQRHFNARKARKVCTFSKDLLFHVAVTWLCVTVYNFCWTPRTLRVRLPGKQRRYRQRTPAMVAGLAAEPWTVEQLFRYPLFPDTIAKKRRKCRRKKRLQREGK